MPSATRFKSLASWSLGFALFFGLSGEAPAEVLHQGGAPERCIDLILLSDGYGAQDERQHRKDCQTIVNQLFKREPFKRYKAYFNVYRNFKASESRNIDRPGATRYGTGRVGLSTSMDSSNRSLIAADALEVAEDVDLILVVCQGDRKGGTARGDRGWVVTYRWFENTTIHELGHMLGNCADEYINVEKAKTLTADIDASLPNHDALVRERISSLIFFRPNVTIESTRELLPWKHWVDDKTPVPAKWSTRGVSAFEGGNYFATIVHRPRKVCAMGGTEEEDFCEPCQEALIQSIYKRTKPTQVHVKDIGEAYEVEVDTFVPEARIRWINAEVRGARVRIPKNKIHPQGIRVEVEDPTSRVRRADIKPELIFTKRLELEGTWDSPNLSSEPPANPGGAPTAEPGATNSTPEAVAETWPRPATVSSGTVRPIVNRVPLEGHEGHAFLLSGPSPNTALLTPVPIGAVVEVLGPSDHGFSEVIFDDRRGYMSTSDLSFTSRGAAGALSATNR